MLKRKGINILITLTILILPFLALQLSNQVNWSLLDFVLMGILLVSLGFVVNRLLNKSKRAISRWGLITLAILVFLLIWAELAVGIFQTPFAGN